MDIATTRQQNMEILAKGKSLAQLAEDTGSSPRHLTQIRGGPTMKGGKAMGSRVARRFETKLGLPHGWMDVPHAADAGAPLEVRMLANFASLPRAFQEHVADLIGEIREHCDSMPEYTKKDLQRPEGPEQRRNWWAQIEADIAKSAKARRENRFTGESRFVREHDAEHAVGADANSSGTGP